MGYVCAAGTIGETVGHAAAKNTRYRYIDAFALHGCSIAVIYAYCAMHYIAPVITITDVCGSPSRRTTQVRDQRAPIPMDALPGTGCKL